MRVNVGSLAAEFPSDNATLHRGVSWVCEDLTGPPRPARPCWADALADALEAGADVSEEAALIVVEELDPIEAEVEGSALGSESIRLERTVERDEPVQAAGDRP